MSKNNRFSLNPFQFLNKGKEERRSNIGSIGSLLFGGSGSGSATSEKAMKIATVYRCVNVIADSIAMLPFQPFKTDSKGYKKMMINTPLYSILNCNPNKRMTRFTMIKTLITSMLLDGNAYLYIERENGNVKALHYIPPQLITINPPQNIVDPLSYTITGFREPISADDMIHIKNFSYDGIVGISTLKHGANVINLATYEENSASGFYSNGCNVSGILSVNAVMSPEAKQNLKKSWQESLNPESGNPSGLVVCEAGVNYTPLSINPEDAELLGSRKWSVSEICRLFGVPIPKAMLYENMSYSTLEQANLSFLSECLQPIMTKIEQEFEAKLFPSNCECTIDVKFDTKALLLTDKSSLGSYYTQMYNIGVYSVNEIRKELNLDEVEGGDSHVSQANLLTIQNIAHNVPANSDIQSENNKEIISE